MSTKIEWCDEVWNPVTGCSKISPGCEHCYAERMAKRLAGRCGYRKRYPFRVTVHKNRMELPLHWKKPRRVFVNSMGDLFHPDVSWEVIDKIYGTMWKASLHRFMILTKRPGKMLEYMVAPPLASNAPGLKAMPHLWLGVTVENQEQAEKRIPVLLQIPAEKRFVSVEPMLGPVDLTGLKPSGITNLDALFGLHGVGVPSHDCEKIDWVICGGETGSGARPMQKDWVLNLRDQCVAAGVPFFFKGWGTAAMSKKDPRYAVIDGRRWEETP